jgi:hypothetical protein
MPPYWVDEHGHRLPVHPCFTCGRVQPRETMAGEHLAWRGWQPVQTFLIAGWCGHPQEYLPIPVGGDRWALMRVWDPATPQRWPLMVVGAPPGGGTT